MSFLYSNPLFVCDMLIHASWIDGVPWSSQSDVITSWRHHWLTSGSSISSRHSHMSTTFANYPCPIIHLPHTSFLLRLHYWTIPPILFIIDPDLWFNIGRYFLHTMLLWFHYITLLLRCIQSFTDMIRLYMQLFDHTSVLLHVYYLWLMRCILIMRCYTSLLECWRLWFIWFTCDKGSHNGCWLLICCLFCWCYISIVRDHIWLHMLYICHLLVPKWSNILTS